MDLKEIENMTGDLSMQTGMFSDFCDFVYYGADYMDGDKDAKSRLHSMLWFISQEARRIEKNSENLYEKIFLRKEELR